MLNVLCIISYSIFFVNLLVKKKNWKFTTKYNLHSFVFPFCMHDVYMVQPAAAASQLIFMALSLGVNVVVFSRVENSRISSIQKDCSD